MANTMILTVKLLSGKKETFTVETGTPVWKLKDSIAKKIGLPSPSQRLNIAGKSLLNSDVITEAMQQVTLHLESVQSYQPFAFKPYIDNPRSIEKQELVENAKLVYKKVTSTVEYSYSPQGSISVARLIKGEAYFKKPLPPQHYQFKTVVLSDWTAEQWSSSVSKRVNQFITQRLEEGFSIYRVDNDDLIRVDGTLTASHRQAMTPKTTDAVRAMASHKHITHDELYVLDAPEISRLFAYNVTDASTIHTHDYKHTRHSKEQVLTVLEQSSLTSITYSVFPDDVVAANDLAVRLNLPIKDKYPALRLNQETLDNLLHHHGLVIDGLILVKSICILLIRFC